VLKDLLHIMEKIGEAVILGRKTAESLQGSYAMRLASRVSAAMGLVVTPEHRAGLVQGVPPSARGSRSPGGMLGW
jgi:hypothetical protein